MAGTFNATPTIDLMRGFLIRPKFIWKDADEFYIDPGAYHTFDGTNHRLVYWDTQLTFAFGSGGSNSDSIDLAGDDWYYLCVDESAVDTLAGEAGTALLTASQLVAVTTEPAWSASKHGQYVSNDRCIGGFRFASATLLEIHHSGGRYVGYRGHSIDLNDQDIDTGWTDVTLEMPKFSTEAQITAYGTWVDDTTDILVRPNGSSGTGHIIGAISGGGIESVASHQINTDSAQIIETKQSSASGNKHTIYTNGYYFPAGM